MSATLDEPLKAETPLSANWSLADLQHFLGDIPARRIRLFPYPGTATEEDALRILERQGLNCELVDGILVEKDMASFESLLGGLLLHWISTFLETHPLGIVLPGDGPLWILPTRMRKPDVSFIRWERFPNRCVPAQDAVFSVAPDLAVEILSEGNTTKEMELKRDEYLEAGVQVIWYIEPRKRTATVYAADASTETFGEDGVLSGGDVLPGFELRLREFFNHFPVEQQDDATT